jgi:poly(beta-D-mannuronate) lyase
MSKSGPSVLLRPGVIAAFAASLVILLGAVVYAANDAGSSLATRVRDGLWLGNDEPSDDSPGINVPQQQPSLGDRSLPSGILNLTNWKLTVPTDGEDSEDAVEIDQPKLLRYQDPRFFHVDAQQKGVVFRADVRGVTTSGSDYPRTELREMRAGGRKEAAWSNRSGTHVMTINQAITATPPKKPEVVAGQIHDGDDDVIMIRLEGTRLFVEAEGKDDPVGVLDANYVLGTPFTVQVTANSAGIRVTYNGTRAVVYKKVSEDMYFKAGAYVQSNKGEGEPKGAYGEVVIYSLSVQHS